MRNVEIHFSARCLVKNPTHHRQVVGVNGQIESGSQGGTPGRAGGNICIGFSIPSNMVASIAHGLIQGAKSHPYVGVTLGTVTPSFAKATGMSAGVEIVAVTKGAPGSKAGLTGATDTKTIAGTPSSTGGDVITKIDGTTVRTSKATAKATPLKLRAEFGSIEIKNIRVKE